jgi:regulator of RNase E activity RraA
MPPGKPGFRILPAPPRLPSDLVERFRGLATANIADAMGRFHFMDPGIVPRIAGPLCGLAITVICRPGDNLMVHKALQLAESGDIIVVSTCGNRTSAVFGGLMCHTAAARRLGGIVVDGAIRDLDDLERLAFPAFSRTVSPGACDKDGPGEINVPVSCGGTVVAAGDLVIGDRDGVVVVPAADAPQVIEEVAGLAARERDRIAEIGRGVLYRAEIDAALRAKGVIV